jgi:hypothetical protein
VDRTGAIVVNPQYEQAFAFSEGLARVVFQGRWGYIR